MPFAKPDKNIYFTIEVIDRSFTSRGRCKGEAVAPEAVVNYREGATTKAL